MVIFKGLCDQKRKPSPQSPPLLSFRLSEGEAIILIFILLFFLFIPRVHSISQDPLILQAITDKTSVYQGELVLYRTIAFQTIDPWYLWTEPVKFNGFEILNFHVSNTQTTAVKFDNREYSAIDMQKTMLLAVKPGDYAIPPAKIRYILTPLAEAQTAISNPVALNVIPLPLENFPSNFSGLVGEFTISAILDQKRAGPGMPLSLTVTVKGTGNFAVLKSLTIPEITQSLRVMPDIPSYNRNQLKIDLEPKVFHFTIIGRRLGDFEIPAFSINYFSPSRHQYMHISTGKIPIIITDKFLKSSQDPIRVESTLRYTSQLIQDIHSIKLNPSLVRTKTIFNTPILLGLIWLNCFGVLMLGIMSLLDRYWPSNSIKYRAHSAYRKAKRHMNMLKKVASKTEGRVFAHTKAVFIQFLEVRTQVPVHLLTLDQIQSVLKKQSYPKRLIKETLSLIEEISSKNNSLVQETHKFNLYLFERVINCMKQLRGR